MVGEPAAESDDGGREQAGRVGFFVFFVFFVFCLLVKTKGREPEEKGFVIESVFSDPTLQRWRKLHVTGGGCREWRV